MYFFSPFFLSSVQLERVCRFIYTRAPRLHFEIVKIAKNYGECTFFGAAAAVDCIKRSKYNAREKKLTLAKYTKNEIENQAREKKMHSTETYQLIISRRSGINKIKCFAGFIFRAFFSICPSEKNGT